MRLTPIAALAAPALALGLLLGSPPAPAQAQALPDFADLVERASPAVVNIRTTSRVPRNHPALPPGMDEDDPMAEFFRRFFPQPGPQGPTPRQGPRSPRGEREMPRGQGSGFVLSADGFLMTNAHVVEGAEEIIVTLPDKREFKGRVIGADKRTDVAIVKIDATGLPTIKVGDPNRMRVGEWVIAIGSPFGLENTVTAGIVSAKGRETGDFLPFIQTDVAVNPGNSGGPLINLRGEVVGINSQIFTTSGGYNGISFAIPIDEAVRVGDQLRATGRVTRGRIGVGIEPVSKDVAEALGLAKPQGALVNSVEKDGPAAKAGVEAGDIILRFDGKPIERVSDLPRTVAGTKPGATVPITVFRKGGSRDLRVTVAEMPAEAAQARATPEAPKPAPQKANALGLAVSDLPAERAKELAVKGGVVVDAVEGAAARSGVRAGDVILAINNTDVANARQFNEIVARLDPKKNAALLVRRGDQASFIIVRGER
jgi:serine protease Do